MLNKYRFILKNILIEEPTSLLYNKNIFPYSFNGSCARIYVSSTQ